MKSINYLKKKNLLFVGSKEWRESLVEGEDEGKKWKKGGKEKKIGGERRSILGGRRKEV